MNSKLLAIARLSFQAALNEKLLHLSVVFAVGMMLLSIALGELGPQAGAKIIADFGLGTIQLVAVLIAIVIASNDMPRELERRTLYVVLSKPIGRSSVVIGKSLGLFAALGLMMLLMGMVFYGMLLFVRLPLSPWFAVSILASALETFLIAGVALLFSLLTSSTLASLYTLVIFFLGHQTGVIRAFGEQAGGAARLLTEVIYRVLPNLEALNLKNDAIYGIVPPTPQLLASFAYGVAWIVALLGLSVLVFRRKEL